MKIYDFKNGISHDNGEWFYQVSFWFETDNGKAAETWRASLGNVAPYEKDANKKLYHSLDNGINDIVGIKSFNDNTDVLECDLVSLTCFLWDNNFECTDSKNWNN